MIVEFTSAPSLLFYVEVYVTTLFVLYGFPVTLFRHTSTCKSYLWFCEYFVYLMCQVPFHLSPCRYGMNWLHVVWKWHHVDPILVTWAPEIRCFHDETKPFSGQCGSQRNHHFSRKCHKNESVKLGHPHLSIKFLCEGGHPHPLRGIPLCRSILYRIPVNLGCFWQGYLFPCPNRSFCTRENRVVTCG